MRTHLNDSSIADAIPHIPTVRRYPCFAANCPMPGTIFTTKIENGDTNPGTCAWHYGVNPSDIPRVTRTLLDWQVVSYESNEARRALTGEIATDPKALNAAFDNAWARLKPQVGEWVGELAPTTIKHRNHAGDQVDSGMPESYGDWAKRLDRFVGARVVEQLRTRLAA